MEFTRLALVYIHLIACCVAVGLVLTSDIAMVKNLFRNRGGDHDPQHLESLKTTVLLALGALWVTGVAIVGLDASVDGLHYFENPKLQAKIVIVSLLTFNGALLHELVLPGLQRAGSLLKLAFGHRTLAAFAGSVSAVSWFYAAMLGVGRPLSWKYSLGQLLAAYPVLIMAATVFMLLLTYLAQYRNRLLAAFTSEDPERQAA